MIKKLIYLLSLIIFVLIIVSPNFTLGQDLYEIYAPKTSFKIKIDGELDEDVWMTAPPAKDFFQSFPFDTSFAETKTEVRILYDDDNIYIAAECFDELKEDYIISSLRRDFSSISDLFEIYIDPFGDGSNGFAFAVNPAGVQREGLLYNGFHLSLEWDTKWFSQVRKYENKWVAEMAIPFKSLRYKGGETEWKINFARIDFKRIEKSTWYPVPRNFALGTLAFTGTLVWEEPLKKAGRNFAIIPYLSARKNKDYVADSLSSHKLNIGGDVKVGITSSLNLDLTFNPDFSQVEVDRQVANLSRFEIYFPERRQFFTENGDLFSRFGFSNIRPFFSRRIGIGKDPVTGLSVQNPILYGAKLSGRLNENWRVGLLNMQEGQNRSYAIGSNNYTVAAFQRKVFSRSNVAGIFVNKENFLYDSSAVVSFERENYNRVGGLEYNLASKDNLWNGKFLFHKSFSEVSKPFEFAHASYLSYNKPTFYFNWNHEFVGENYNAEVGYVPRKNYWRIEPSAGYYLNPKESIKINKHGLEVRGNLYKDKNFKQTLDSDLEVGYRINFKNVAEFWMSYKSEYTYLFSSFDPTNTGGKQLETGSSYRYRSYRIWYKSDPRKLFNFHTYLRAGEYYNGNLYASSGGLAYRVQPFGKLALDYSVNKIKLPEPYSSANLILFGPRIEWSFTKSLFLTTTFQYNNQINNLNTNIRFQWRFRPVSDLFIVYSDNYYSDNIKAKNRGIVMKLTYWINI